MDKSSPYNAVVEVDGCPVTMEIDTRAVVSLMSAVTFEALSQVDQTQLQCSCAPTWWRVT